MPAKRIFGEITPTITLTKKGQVRFNTTSREIFKIKEHVYFRLFLDKNTLFLISGIHPDAYRAKADNCTSINNSNLCELLFKHFDIKQEKVVLEVGPAIEKRYEGFLQYPLIFR